MVETPLACDYERVIAQARSGLALTQGFACALAEDAAMILARSLPPAEKRVCRDARILELRRLTSPGASRHAAAQTILRILDRYQMHRWPVDQQAGRCVSDDRVTILAFDIMMFGGPPKLRALQTILERT